jgi:hypothetical protein
MYEQGAIRPPSEALPCVQRNKVFKTDSRPMTDTHRYGKRVRSSRS